MLRKNARGKKLGYEAVKLALGKLKELNISPIVLTCEESNEPSWRLIEHFEYTKCEKYLTLLNGVKTPVRRYWLK